MTTEPHDHLNVDSEWTVVGERIRRAREDAGISVRELARRIGVSPSHVSNVERGLASFSVRALYNVVNTLQISIDSLFEESLVAVDAHAPDDPIPFPVPVEVNALEESGILLRRANRPSINLGTRRWERLTARSALRTAEFLEVRYPPGSTESDGPDFIHHPSREWGVVIQGNLHIQVGFEEAVLHPGDSISFESKIPHRFWNEGDQEVVAIWFVLDEDSVEKHSTHEIFEEGH